MIPIISFVPLKSLALSLHSGGPYLRESEVLLSPLIISPSHPTYPICMDDQLGAVIISISDRVRATTGELMLGEELGLHRSNRLPWKRIFLESCFRVSQMVLTSSWQSDSAVRAHVWKASQWLWQTKDHQINVASAISLKNSSQLQHADMHSLSWIPLVANNLSLRWLGWPQESQNEL